MSQMKDRVKSLIIKLLQDDLTETEGDAVYLEIQELAPNPECLDFIYHSNTFYDADGVLDVDSVVDKCFDHKPIAL